MYCENSFQKYIYIEIMYIYIQRTKVPSRPSGKTRNDPGYLSVARIYAPPQ